MTFNKRDALLLVVRLIIGGIFITVGWMKISTMAETAGFFAALGLPAFLAYVVAYAELLGGIALVLGVWAGWASIGLAIIMLGAIYFSRQGGFPMMSMPLSVIASLLGIMASGAGAYALPVKRWLQRRSEQSATPAPMV